MRLSTPNFFRKNEDACMWVLMLTVFLPLTLSLLTVVCLMWAIGFVVWIKRKSIGPKKGWSKFFAWHPVNVGDVFGKDWRWLEFVERRNSVCLESVSCLVLGDYPTQYRKPNKANPN